MFFTKIPENENIKDYYEIKVDGKIFYGPRQQSSEKNAGVKRRYSDQFKDPLFTAKDTYRKLNMIKQFKIKYKDIGLITKRYIDCIENCICILEKEFSIVPRTVFQSFDLKQLGINPDDFGVEKEECASESE
ncbi:uncharacterized protein VICG_00358 [Vittaforma corneae ATCC 50505]|uniref:Uncharacterized protein n=1 Tax=Vittaforma corneae (strain ATCC 50505) TaxID=993615 RepID=L2GP61_VITCO|nr:uncharacterized protein VICG_00358 [Vittaforma corneae ATCC 50505]ELA42606.1 hypothetical protein VICG_00358 [Vittaforma corneae ATCC 50505]